MINRNPTRYPQRLAVLGVFLLLTFAFLACKQVSTTDVRKLSDPSVTANQAGPAAEIACPSQDFEGFLKAYASDEQVRRRFTSPTVMVARISDEGAAGYRKVIESVPAAEYAGFLLAYRNGKYTFAGISPDEEAASPGLSLIVTAEPGETYFVTIPDDTEGISYRFERHEECWRLIEDPDATP